MKRGRAAALLLAVAVVLPAGSATRAAKLPDWAKQIADTAPEYDDSLPEFPSRVLLSEVRLIVDDDGTLRVRRRKAEQALSPTAEEIGLGYFPFEEGSRFITSKGWHLPPVGRAKKSRGGVLDLSLDDVFLSDEKVRVIRVAGIERGSLVFFEFEAVEAREQLAYTTLFHEDVPVDVARFELHTPPAWSVRYTWLRTDGPEPSVTETTHVWNLNGLRPSEDEAMGEPAVDRAPLLLVSVVPPPEVTVEAAVLPDWLALARWYEQLALGRDEVTPEIAATARDLLAETEAGFFPRVRSTGRFVRDQVRYVAKEIGVGGYRPRPADRVLHRLYGDCKDKGTLFRALLAAEGQQSYPVLVNASRPNTVSDELPALWSFNHFVVAVPVPESTPPPPAYRPATVGAGELGQLLIVDTTDEYTSIGSLPDYLGGKMAFVVAGESSRLVTLPEIDPDAHRVDRHFEVDLHEGGSATLRLRTTRFGAPAAAARYAYRQSAKDYRHRVEQELGERWPLGSIRELEVTDELPDGTFVENVTVELAAADDPASAELLRLFPGALDELPRVPLSRREAAVKYAHALSLHFEATIRNVPELTPVPMEIEREGPGWSTACSFSREGRTLHGSWEMKLARLRFEPEEFRDLKRLWSAARRASSASVSLAR